MYLEGLELDCFWRGRIWRLTLHGHSWDQFLPSNGELPTQNFSGFQRVTRFTTLVTSMHSCTQKILFKFKETSASGARRVYRACINTRSGTMIKVAHQKATCIDSRWVSAWMAGYVATFLLSERQSNLVELVRVTDVSWRMASSQFQFFIFVLLKNASALVSLQHHLNRGKPREEQEWNSALCHWKTEPWRPETYNLPRKC